MLQDKKEGLWLWLVPTDSSVIELDYQRGKLSIDYYIHNFPFHLTICQITHKNKYLTKYLYSKTFNNIIEIVFKKRIYTDNYYNSITYIPESKDEFLNKLSLHFIEDINALNDDFDPHVSIVYNNARHYDGQKLNDKLIIQFNRLVIGYANEEKQIWSIIESE